MSNWYDNLCKGSSYQEKYKQKQTTSKGWVQFLKKKNLKVNYISFLSTNGYHSSLLISCIICHIAGSFLKIQNLGLKPNLRKLILNFFTTVLCEYLKLQK